MLVEAKAPLESTDNVWDPFRWSIEWSGEVTHFCPAGLGRGHPTPRRGIGWSHGGC